MDERKSTDPLLNERRVNQAFEEGKIDLIRILDSNPIIFFYKNKNGKIRIANQALAKSLNTTQEAILGKTVFDLYSKEIAQSMTNDDRDIFQSKKPKLNIIESKETPSGLRWIKTDKFPTFDQKGAVNGIFGFSIDITDQMEAEGKLKENEEKYKQLVDKLPEMVFEIDNRGKVVLANSRAVEILGYTAEELRNDFGANRFVAPEDVERSSKDMQEMLLHGTRCSDEYVFCKKNGERLPVLLTSTPIVKGDKIIGGRGIAVDLSQQKEMAKRLKENELLAAIGQTAGMVGHDIRNPLQAMISDVYLLKQELSTKPECKAKEGVAESLDSIEKNISYINKIVADLQDYARPLNPHYTEVDLSKVLTEVVENVGVPDDIKVVINSDTSQKIKTEATFISRILTNLVSNAIQAMPVGGNLELTAFVREDKVYVTVADTGVGIPEYIKPKLFSPMFTTKAKGQGLGLAVVKRFVEVLGGTISFKSEEGNGTKFTVQLPLNYPSKSL